ncbi:MAG: hypothetical protein ACWA5T_08070 [Parvularcula sp.]
MTQAMVRKQQQRGNGNAITLVMVIFIALVAIGTWAAYHYGGDHISINGRGVSELEPWEVVGGVIIGILGAVFGLMMGAFGLVIGLIAMVASIVLALAGVAVGLFVSAGTLLGPFLLLAAIILLLRKQNDETKPEKATRSGGEQSTAQYWT